MRLPGRLFEPFELEALSPAKFGDVDVTLYQDIAVKTIRDTVEDHAVLGHILRRGETHPGFLPHITGGPDKVKSTASDCGSANIASSTRSRHQTKDSRLPNPKPDSQEQSPWTLPTAPTSQTPAWRGMIATAFEGLVASAIPVKPPKSWFQNPGLDRVTPLQISASGQVYGHVATWKQEHIGMAGKVKAPKSRSNYAFFATGMLETAEGEMVNVGQITLAGGHASLEASVQDVVAHYDNTQSGVMDVAIGEDAHGIWVAGALRPDVDDLEAAHDPRIQRVRRLASDQRQPRTRRRVRRERPRLPDPAGPCRIRCPGRARRCRHRRRSSTRSWSHRGESPRSQRSPPRWKRSTSGCVSWRTP